MITALARTSRGLRSALLLFLGLTLPLQFLSAPALLAKEPSQRLRTVRGGHHGDYATIVFEFTTPFTFESPVITDREVTITFRNTATAVAPYRRYRSFASWLRVSIKEGEVEARMGIPRRLPHVDHFLLNDPDRLVLRFSRKPVAPEQQKPRAPEETEGKTERAAVPVQGAAKKSAVPAAAPEEAPKAAQVSEAAPVAAQAKAGPAKQKQERPPALQPSPGKEVPAEAQPPIERISPAAPLPQEGGISWAPAAPGGAAAWKPAAPAPDKPPAPGGPPQRSYNYRDLDIRQALSALAQDQDISIIMSPEVAGKITVHLNQVTLEEALNSITKSGGFAYTKHDENYYIYKPKEVRDPQAERLQIRIFRLQFASIEKVQDILASLPGMRTIRIHEPSKTVLVEDTPENIAKIEKVLESWDRAPRQVLIEARIMQVTLTDDMRLGVDWSKVFGDLAISTTGFATAASGLAAALTTAAGTRDAFSVALKALQAKTQVQILSTPKILAIHGKIARVQVGGRQGYTTSTVSQGVITQQVQFLDTGTILDITPFIDDGGNVLLEVRPQINSVTFDANRNPNQQTTTVSTSMMAKSGQTIFIGGLIEDKKEGVNQEVPCIGGIPGIGLLFGSKQDTINKSELVILITPEVQDLDRKAAPEVDKVKSLEETLKREPKSVGERIFERLP